MADGTGDRTEKATPKRLEKAREEGQIAKSEEVPSALMISMLLIVMALTGPGLYGWLAMQMREGLALRADNGLDSTAVCGLLSARAIQSCKIMMPFLLAGCLVSVLGSLIVSGWAYCPKALKLDFARLSPMSGLKNLMSMKSLVHLLISLAKIAVIGTVAYGYLHDRVDQVLVLRFTDAAGALAETCRILLGLTARLAIALLVIGAVDLIYQKWRHQRELRMTVQEVKEERKQYELNPQIRGRIHAVQIEMVRRRMLQEVSKADVVVVNPTHVAVALRYDAVAMDAPRVVAKGPDLLCEKIKELARAHQVPIVQRPDLARALYATVDIGRTVPPALFVAVAEVLAMIYRLRRARRSGPGGANG